MKFYPIGSLVKVTSKDKLFSRLGIITEINCASTSYPYYTVYTRTRFDDRDPGMISLFVDCDHERIVRLA